MFLICIILIKGLGLKDTFLESYFYIMMADPGWKEFGFTDLGLISSKKRMFYDPGTQSCVDLGWFFYHFLFFPCL